jgi:hypothetical protein
VQELVSAAAGFFFDLPGGVSKFAGIFALTTPPLHERLAHMHEPSLRMEKVRAGAVPPEQAIKQGK